MSYYITVVYISCVEYYCANCAVFEFARKVLVWMPLMTLFSWRGRSTAFFADIAEDSATMYICLSFLLR